MTTATPPTSPTDDASEGLEVDLAALIAGHNSRKPRRSRWWRIGYPVAVVLLALAIPVLVWTGLRVILDSSDGQLVRRVTDPAAPGYEAVLEPTPTDLLVTVGPGGELDSISVLALGSEGAGGVLSVPADLTIPTGEVGGGSISLRFVHDTFGLEALRGTVGGLLDLTFTDAQAVAAADWASLVAPVAPLAVDNPDPVVGPDGAVLFPRGSLQLAADDVWPYLSGRGPRESDLNRLVRQQALLRAFFTRIGVQGPGALTIPTDAGLGRFLAALGPGQVQFETLPVTTLAPAADGTEQFEAQPEAVLAAVASIVPFPEGAPGGRPRLRVLDGTGQLDNGVAAAITLAAAGAQVDVVGNARSYGATTTQFVYYDPAYEAAARQLRDALGLGEIVRSDQTNSATDLTVVLGEDYLAVAGDTPAAVAQPSTLDGTDG